MKNVMNIALVAMTLFCVTLMSCNSSKGSSAGGAKTITEGHIVYDIKAEGGMASMMTGSTMELFFTPENAKMGMNMMSGMVKMDILVDNKKKEGLMLMDMMGQRKAAKMNKEDLDAKEQERVNQKPSKAEYKKNYKDIAGYKCQEVHVTMDGLETPAIVYVTEKLKPANLDQVNMQFNNLKGFPLSWTIEQQGMKITMEASSVSLDKVDKKIFDMKIPEGYEEMSIEEMQQMGGGIGM